MIIKDECEVCGNRFYAETSDYVSACLREYDIWSNSHHDNCKSRQWEPERGSWFADHCNRANTAGSTYECRLAGRERATRELAQKAAEASRMRDRLEAFRDEGWPGQEGNYCVVKDWGGDYYTHCHNGAKIVGTVYGPRDFAEKAAEMLKSGELVL